jgi:hypothetical protein
MADKNRYAAQSDVLAQLKGRRFPLIVDIVE